MPSHVTNCLPKMLRRTYSHAKNLFFYSSKKSNQTIDGISVTKPNPTASASDVHDGPDSIPIENQELLRGTELNQFEISSDDDESSLGAARSRPVRAAANRRKNRVAANGKGRKKRNDESDDVFIE